MKKFKKFKWYCDMDGVLARFDKEPNAVNRFAVEQDFFYSLKANRYIRQLNNELGSNESFRNRFYILSASPNERCDNDKLRWLAKYLPNIKKENIIVCRNGENKADYIKVKKRAVLLDDYTNNLLDVKKLGVTPIKYVNSGDNKVGKHTENKIPYVTNLLEMIRNFA